MDTFCNKLIGRARNRLMDAPCIERSASMGQYLPFVSDVQTYWSTRPRMRPLPTTLLEQAASDLQ